MTDPDSLLQEYIAAHQAAGAPPDPGPFLRRASPSDRPALAALIEARLQRAPRRPFDAAAFEEARRTPLMRSIEQAAGGVSGLWPALLPRLRDGARIKRADLVRDLA